MSGTILILEVIRKNGKVVDTVCDMDGFRGHMSPESLVGIWERDHSAVPNIHELIAEEVEE